MRSGSGRCDAGWPTQSITSEDRLTNWPVLRNFQRHVQNISGVDSIPRSRAAFSTTSVDSFSSRAHDWNPVIRSPYRQVKTYAPFWWTETHCSEAGIEMFILTIGTETFRPLDPKRTYATMVSIRVWCPEISYRSHLVPVWLILSLRTTLGTQSSSGCEYSTAQLRHPSRWPIRKRNRSHNAHWLFVYSTYFLHCLAQLTQNLMRRSV